MKGVPAHAEVRADIIGEDDACDKRAFVKLPAARWNEAER